MRYVMKEYGGMDVQIHDPGKESPVPIVLEAV
jgi:hypothetical protein